MPRFALIFACLLSLPFLIHAELVQKALPVVTDLTLLTKHGKHLVSINIGNHDRRFVFYTPKGFRGRPLPIVFFFHGAGGNAEQAARTYGWVEKADKENFFVAFPQGLPVRVNEEGSFLLNPNIWRDERAGLPAAGVNDVGFFDQLLGRLQATVPIDSRRIYITGFSNGAGMTFTLGAHFSSRIAAIAPVSSQSFVKVDSLARAMPVYYLAGTADPLIPYGGGTTTLPWGNTREFPPVQETVDTWAKLDGCPLDPTTVSDKDGVRVLRYGPGLAQSEILFTTIEGNGHHWPGTIEPLPAAISGPSLNPFHATDCIWEFFQEHPLVTSH